MPRFYYRFVPDAREAQATVAVFKKFFISLPLLIYLTKQTAYCYLFKIALKPVNYLVADMLLHKSVR